MLKIRLHRRDWGKSQDSENLHIQYYSTDVSLFVLFICKINKMSLKNPKIKDTQKFFTKVPPFKRHPPKIASGGVGKQEDGKRIVPLGDLLCLHRQNVSNSVMLNSTH